MVEALENPASSDLGGSKQPNNAHPGDEHPVPAYEAHDSFASLKERIKRHYELASDYYYSLWGEHIHHGWFQSPEDTKEQAQINLINLLVSISKLSKNLNILDVGCGLGGTSRYLAQEHGCKVTGITISSRQVQLASKLSLAASGTNNQSGSDGFIPIGQGAVRFLEMDAETMNQHFSPNSFDIVWISEAMSHLPDKPLFFRNTAMVLKPEGKLVVADWFKDMTLTTEQMEADIKPIEDGMLLPPLCTQQDYVDLAQQAGLSIFHEPKDISKDVSKTWDISWSLVSSPSLWAFAISQGRDGLAFLQAFRAMRRGFANGSFRYAVMAFDKRAEKKDLA